MSVPDYPLQNVAGLTGAANLQQNLDKMLRINQETTAGVGVLLDRAIRGLGPFSLDNEALEQLIVTLIATSVQKAMEKATWCYYACDLNTALEQAERELKADVAAGEKKLEGKLASYAHEKTEQIRLHLKIVE
jgi:hypothetical protein